MGDIRFNLTNASTLAGMAPPALPGGAFGPAALPAGLVGAGMYIIVNTATNNRYMGIAGNLANRFQTRMETVTECGFSVAQMGQLGVFWGTANYRNTPVGGIMAPWTPVPAYVAPLNIPVDHVNVNFERLLIRFVLTQLGAGGTVSNNMMATTPYVNPTPNAITVTLNWGGFALFAPGIHTAIWAPGAAW
jgi:hypothetical protein